MAADKISLSTLKGEGDLSDLELDELVLTDLLDLPTWIRVTRATCNRLTIKVQPLLAAAVLCLLPQAKVARWCNGQSVGLAINMLRVQILLEATLSNNLGQVVHTYVPLSSSSLTWYWPKGGDALRLGR